MGLINDAFLRARFSLALQQLSSHCLLCLSHSSPCTLYTAHPLRRCTFASERHRFHKSIAALCDRLRTHPALADPVVAIDRQSLLPLVVDEQTRRANSSAVPVLIYTFIRMFLTYDHSLLPEIVTKCLRFELISKALEDEATVIANFFLQPAQPTADSIQILNYFYLFLFLNVIILQTFFNAMSSP